MVDSNSYWYIPHNPISKIGVFSYLGRSISPDCEPNKIYKVYRPAETLAESVATWDNPPKPLIEDHEMLGEGFTDVDERPMQGIIYNPVYDDGVLYADIAVYTENMKKAIEGGKKELSLGYFCNYRKESGVYNGEVYDYVQTDMVGNHCALVGAGRCGSDIKVFDHNITMDSLDIAGEFVESDSNLKKNDEDAIIETTEEKDSGMEKENKVEEIVKDEAVEEVKAEAKEEVAEVVAEKPAEEVKDEKPVEATDAEEVAEEEAKDEAEEEAKAEDEVEAEAEDECEKAEDADKLEEIYAMLREIKEILTPKATDADEIKEEEKAEVKAEDVSEEEKPAEDEEAKPEADESEAEAEDECAEKEEDKVATGDSCFFVFGKNDASQEDEALKEYLK